MLKPSILSSATYLQWSINWTVERPANPGMELNQLVVGARVVEADIGTRCRAVSKPSAGRPPTRCVGDAGVDQFGMLGFERS